MNLTPEEIKALDTDVYNLFLVEVSAQLRVFGYIQQFLRKYDKQSSETKLMKVEEFISGKISILS